MIGEELALYLQEKGYGTKDVDLFLGFQPDTPDNCITVYDETTPVIPESHTLSVDELGIQVLIRNLEYSQARNIAMNIHSELCGFGGEPFVSGPTVHALYVATIPSSIGRDDKGRSEWSGHYRMRVESEGDAFRN